MDLKVTLRLTYYIRYKIYYKTRSNKNSVKKFQNRFPSRFSEDDENNVSITKTPLIFVYKKECRLNLFKFNFVHSSSTKKL